MRIYHAPLSNNSLIIFFYYWPFIVAKAMNRHYSDIATCKQNVGQKEDLMHSNFQMDISLPWIDAAFT